MSIRESLNQIMASREVIGEQFYEVFFERCPDVKSHFAGVDLKRQAALLTSALLVVERFYTSPNRALEQYLQVLGTRHHGWKIPREQYPFWRDAMLETLQRFHGESWNDELNRQWNGAIDEASRVMFEGYEEHFHV